MRSSLLVSLLALLACCLSAQEGYTYHPMAAAGGTSGPHWGRTLYLPAGYASNSNTYPLVVYMNGYGERGTGATVAELQRLNITSLPKLLAEGMTQPAIIVCPQNDTTGWHRSDYVVDLINWMAANYRVNVDKVIVTGMSVGGAATWSITDAYPGAAAAFVPIAGAAGFNQTGIINLSGQPLRRRPVWAFHNDPDGSVAYYLTPHWINAISYGASMPVDCRTNLPAWQTNTPATCRTVWKNSTGGFTWNATEGVINGTETPRHTVWPNGGHGMFERPYQQASVWAWMLAQTSAPITLASTPASLTIAPSGTYTMALTVDCATMHPDYVKMSVVSSNLTVLPASALVLGGSGSARTLTINAAATSGTAVVTITGSDWSRTPSDLCARNTIRTITVNVQSLTDRITVLEGQLSARNTTLAQINALSAP